MFNEAELDLIVELTRKVSKGVCTVDEALAYILHVTILPIETLTVKLKTVIDDKSFVELYKYWLVINSDDKVMLERFLFCELDEWMDIFCTGCTIVDFIEGGEYFSTLYNSRCILVERISELEKDLDNSRTELKVQEGVLQFLEKNNMKGTFYQIPQGPTPTSKIKDKTPLVDLQILYLIRSGNALKIGITKDLKARLSSLQISSPYKMSLITTYSPTQNTAFNIEQSLHKYFKDFRLYGEWFNIDINIEEFLSLCSKYDKKPHQ
jgi:hypothetical protein